MEIIRSFKKDDLQRFEKITIQSATGFSTTFDINELNSIEIHESGLVIVEKNSGDLRFYSLADLYFVKKNI